MSREGSPVAPAAEAAQSTVEKKEDAPITTAAEDLKAAAAAVTKDATESAPAEEAATGSDKPEDAPAPEEAEQTEEKPDVEMADAADAAEAEATSQPLADNEAEASAAKGKAAKRKSIGAADAKGKKLTRKSSKPRILHTDAQPGEHYFVKLKGFPQWPVIICDEEMLPDSLLKSRPVTAKRQDGTYRDDYADGGKKVADRTFPVMYLHTNEFGWVPNAELIDLDPEEVKLINTDKMRKDLQAAHKLAIESNPLQFYKDLLHEFQEDLLEKEKARAAKAATPKGKKKVAATADEDVEMDEDGEASTPPKEKKSKKRKADEPVDTSQRPESVKKPKIKLTSSATPKPTNGATPTPKAKADAKGNKPKSKKAKDGEDKKEASEAPKEPELSPQEQRERKEREVLFLRHKLQKGLLTRDQEPKEEEMSTMSEYITKLEGFPTLEVSIIRTTKINKVLKAILKLENIPKEKEYNFKSRSQVLLDKWNALLAVESGAAAPAPAAKGAQGVNGTAPKETKTNGVKAKEEEEAQDGKKDEYPAGEKVKEKSEESSEPADKMDIDEPKPEAVEASA